MFIDSAAYDLGNPEDQKKALQDIIDEQNRQYDRSQSLQGYQIVAYASLTLDLIDGSPSGIYTTPYVHGLGYPPQCLGFGFNFGNYNPLIYVDKAGGIFTPVPNAQGYSYWTVDNQNLYFNILAISSGGHFPFLHFTGSFYITNLPLNI